ncbi:hypothetical protein ACKKBG_A12955 [Auxenochlorella protothecoides x Auxenochlorella symbiontica]
MRFLEAVADDVGIWAQQQLEGGGPLTVPLVSEEYLPILETSFPRRSWYQGRPWGGRRMGCRHPQSAAAQLGALRATN